MQLKDIKIAILASNGFEEVELTEPKEKLEKEGATTYIISDNQTITSWHQRNWHKSFHVDKQISEVDVEEYDLLLLPGGVINPDRLRRNHEAVDLVKQFNEKGKLIAAICHGPQMLIDADIIKGKKLTSFKSIKKDLLNAGAIWIDKEVVEDGNFITSRTPKDIPAFCDKITKCLNK